MKKSNDFNFVTVIRAAGERTRDICRQIVIKELNEKDVYMIECTPFEEALRESYRIGMNSDKKWMITIDADVLPRAGFLSEIDAITKHLPDKIFTFKAMIFDKLFLTHRMAGFRVYRNKFLHTAMGYIPANGEVIRPESYTIRKMEEAGYKTKVFEYVAGVHDYEQYYKDIYRKAYFHAAKHTGHIAESFTTWREKSEHDPDYRVALKGAVDGLLAADQPKPDIRYFETISDNAVRELGLVEKDEADEETTISLVNKVLESTGNFHKEYSIGGIRNKIKQKGFIGGILDTIGYFMETAGSKMKDIR
jgi:hypothetical protein